MTIDEFEVLEPVLARALRGYAYHHQIDGVYEDAGRWEAHCSIMGTSIEMERCFEARCHPSCVDNSGRPRTWVWEDHVCCEQCKTNPGHRYETVHE